MERGYAEWTDASCTGIRFRDAVDVVVARQTESLIERDRRYWREIARERGGADVQFCLRVSPSYPSGIVGLEFIPAIVDAGK